MKTIFDRKLYLVGLKKIKLVGIICGIILIVCNALVPVASLASSMMNGGNDSTTLTASDYAVANPLLLLLVPMFFFSMFSFLNHRNESDFYHSIPFKRTCILGSFTAAIFTWVFGILLASLLLNGLLFAVDPAMHFSPLVPLQLFAFFAFVSLYVGAFALLAMTLTGTTVSNCAVSLILFFFVRVIAAITIEMLESLVPILDISYSPLRFLSARYWLPAAAFRPYYDLSVFRDVGLWVYSAVVLIALYALSVWCFCRRKSESAGKSASNRILQHAFRCAFTLPLALLTVFGVMEGSGAAFAVVMILLTLMVYYLYELVTVKKIRQTLLSTPLLLVPALCCALIVGGCYFVRGAVLEQNYAADQIESVRFYLHRDFWGIFDRTYTYELTKTDGISVSDPEANEIIANALDDNIHRVQTDDFNRYRPDYNDHYVEIQLKSGRKIRRQLSILQTDVNRVENLRQASDAYREVFLQLPSDEEIDSVTFGDRDILTSESSQNKDIRDLWDTFVAEYGELSDEEKLAYKNQYATYSYTYFEGDGLTAELYFNVSGNLYDSYGSSPFETRYFIPSEFERTRSLYAEYTQSARDEVRQVIQNFIDGKYDALFDGSDKSVTTIFNFDGNGLWNRTPVFPRGYYENEYYRSSGINVTRYNGTASAAPAPDVLVTTAQNDPEAGKEFFRALLPYLTDTPEENSYLYFWFLVLDDDGMDSHYNTIFGLSGNMPDELKSALNGEWYPSEIGVLSMTDILSQMQNGILKNYGDIYDPDTLLYGFSCTLSDGTNISFESFVPQNGDSVAELDRCSQIAEVISNLLMPYGTAGCLPCEKMTMTYYVPEISGCLTSDADDVWSFFPLTDDVTEKFDELGVHYTLPG